MARRSDSTLVPRNGHSLQVGIIARISGCSGQKEVSLEDQIDHGKEEAGQLYKGQMDFDTISTKGKGERLDRPELAQVEVLFRSKKLDLCIMEDVGRLVRGAEACRLWGIAVDHGTRVIAPNDCVDTAEEHWEEDLMSACRDHTAHQTHTSKRIKKKLMARFLRSGEITPLPIAGYIKPDGATSYTDWRKDESAAKIIAEGHRILKQTLRGPAVADYFNEVGFPTGPAAKTKTKWDGTLVLSYYRNTLLKGMPARGKRHSVKHHESGRRNAVRNPDGPQYRHEPHLAFVEPSEFDLVVELLDKKNEKYRRARCEDEDPRYRTPRKRTRSFGQHARCWYCGRHYVWGANGRTDNLMCSGSRKWKCWNSIGFNGPLAAEKLVAAITARLDRIDGIDQQFRDLVCAAQSNDQGVLEHRRAKLLRDEVSLARAKENLGEAIAKWGPNEMLRDKLAELETREKCLAGERYYLESAVERKLDVPESAAQLRSLLYAEFRRVAINSYEFGELLRELVPEIHVYLVRLFDGGHLLPRAKVRLNLLGSIADAESIPGLRELLDEELTLDLFEPPQREAIRLDAVRLDAGGLDQRQIARELGSKPTQTAVWNALNMLVDVVIADARYAALPSCLEHPVDHRIADERHFAGGAAKGHATPAHAAEVERVRHGRGLALLFELLELLHGGPEIQRQAKRHQLTAECGCHAGYNSGNEPPPAILAWLPLFGDLPDCACTWLRDASISTAAVAGR
ncbi:MAG TPA: hypothetical protein VMP01_26965 [Pirellulaceae bacterium]|nr:hypothetical protein [Pirellulaceae bacterium]